MKRKEGVSKIYLHKNTEFLIGRNKTLLQKCTFRKKQALAFTNVIVKLPKKNIKRYSYFHIHIYAL